MHNKIDGSTTLLQSLPSSTTADIVVTAKKTGGHCAIREGSRTADRSRVT